MRNRIILQLVRGALFTFWLLTDTHFVSAQVDSISAELNLPLEEFKYSQAHEPEYFRTENIQVYNTAPIANPVTDSGATLGRTLFYDRRLSFNHSLSCASCHVQKFSFADPRAVSVGFDGKLTDRNSLALNDIALQRAGFFWDERTTTLEETVLIPVFSHIEMGLNEDLLIERLSTDARYISLFQKAFKSPEITVQKMSFALAQFLRAMTTCNSRYDQGVTQAGNSKADFFNFTPSENLGKKIFFEKCSSCHTLPSGDQTAVFAMFRSLNNGSDFNANARDGGRGDAVFNPSEIGAFKTSSLRNVELTAPYFHDGRLETLEDVIEFYSTGVHRHPNIGPITRFHFTTAEKMALVDFLKTLTDRTLIEDQRFSDPWTPATPLPDPLTEDQKTQSRHVSPHKSQTGLTLEETVHWLKDLDQNQDGSLSPAELLPLIAVLKSTGAMTPVSRTRNAAARAGVRASDGPSSAIVVPRLQNRPESEQVPATDINQNVGDFDGDGTVTAEEAAQYAAFQRLMQFGGGGRDEVFIDRFLLRFQVSQTKKDEARQSLRNAKKISEESIRAIDLETSQELAALLGDQQFAKFQSSVVYRQTEIPLQPDPPKFDDILEAFLWQSDLNQDGRLDADEIEHLAIQISRVPGGFAQGRHPAPDLAGIVFRLMTFDQDGNGLLARDELPERIQHFVMFGDQNEDGKVDLQEAQSHLTQVAYSRYLDVGIYIGGAFANTLSVSLPTIQDLEITEEQRTEANAILERHIERVKQLGENATTHEFTQIQQILYGI